MKSTRIIFLLVLFLLSACATGGLDPVETATPPSVPASATATFTPPPTAPTVTATPRPLAKRVLIVSFDGLRPDAIAAAPMNNLLALMQSGAYTLDAQTVMPSTTLPAHASMLDGMCPSKHGVYWDEYVPENGYALGVDLFDLAHAAGLRTVMLVGKEKLRQVTEPESTDVFIYKETETTIANLAVPEIKQGFGLMFVHFPEGDIEGHEYGWMSKTQFWWLRQEDGLLKRLLDALDANGLRDSTLIIVTSDHGGHGTSHNGDQPEDRVIPWIVAGTGVHPGVLRSPVNITDTAATAAFMLGLPIPPDWDGRPVTEAFGLPIEPRVGDVCLQTH